MAAVHYGRTRQRCILVLIACVSCLFGTHGLYFSEGVTGQREREKHAAKVVRAGSRTCDRLPEDDRLCIWTACPNHYTSVFIQSVNCGCGTIFVVVCKSY